MTRASVVVLLVMAAACGKQPTGGDGGGGAGGGGSGGGGGMAPCTAPRIMCRGLCIDTSTDPADCGSCDHQCSANVSCVGGICGVPVALVSGGPTSARG